MSVTLSSLPGKFKCSLLNVFFLFWWNYSQLRFNWSRDELISEVLLWTPTYGRAKVGRPARTCIQQLCEDVALKTCQRRWTIGRSGERGSEISVLAARHDDDDDDIYISKKFQNYKQNYNSICSDLTEFNGWHRSRLIHTRSISKL